MWRLMVGSCLLFLGVAGFLGVAVSCVPTDITGCPLDKAEAIGLPCPDDGVQCGEFSLCDPCTSDLSECELIECSGGSWQNAEVSDVCGADGGS